MRISPFFFPPLFILPAVQEVEFTLGSHLTVIAGQNGTQKTTLLGLLTHFRRIN
jgi:predicted ATPase